MRHLMALLLCVVALGAGASVNQRISGKGESGVQIYPTPSGMPCASWRAGKPYQRAIWQRYYCDSGGKRWADGKGGNHG